MLQLERGLKPVFNNISAALFCITQTKAKLHRQLCNLPASCVRARPVRRQIRTDKIRDCAIIIRREGAEKLELSSKNLDSTPLQNKKN